MTHAKPTRLGGISHHTGAKKVTVNDVWVVTRFRVFLFFVVLVLTSACNGGSPTETISPLPASDSGEADRRAAGLSIQALLVRTGETNKGRHDERVSSWMRTGAASLDLLYVSDEGTNAVYVYSWPQARLVGKLTHISYPQGECGDAAGHVFITSFDPSYGSRILKYAHGGTKPLLRVEDKGYFASGCAIDPQTGNLAVTNLETTDLRFGNLAVYNRLGQLVGLYAGGGMAFYFFCGYDSAGNLYVDGARDFNPYDGFAFAELPAGSSALTNISLNQSFNYPGGVQWDGTYVAVGDSYENAIYRFSIKGSGGTEVGSTPLEGGSYVLQFWIQGRKLVGPNAGTATAMLWDYPAGGTATKTLRKFTDPVGSVVSSSK
jgi:hypothetical protein